MTAPLKAAASQTPTGLTADAAALSEGAFLNGMHALTPEELSRVVAQRSTVLLNRIADLERRNQQLRQETSTQRARAATWKLRWQRDFRVLPRNRTLLCGTCQERVVPC